MKKSAVLLVLFTLARSAYSMECWFVVDSEGVPHCQVLSHKALPEADREPASASLKAIPNQFFTLKQDALMELKKASKGVQTQRRAKAAKPVARAAGSPGTSLEYSSAQSAE